MSPFYVNLLYYNTINCRFCICLLAPGGRYSSAFALVFSCNRHIGVRRIGRFHLHILQDYFATDLSLENRGEYTSMKKPLGIFIAFTWVTLFFYFSNMLVPKSILYSLVSIPIIIISTLFILRKSGFKL
jgi:hypothetical protein